MQHIINRSELLLAVFNNGFINIFIIRKISILKVHL